MSENGSTPAATSATSGATIVVVSRPIKSRPDGRTLPTVVSMRSTVRRTARVTVAIGDPTIGGVVSPDKTEQPNWKLADGGVGPSGDGSLGTTWYAEITPVATELAIRPLGPDAKIPNGFDVSSIDSPTYRTAAARRLSGGLGIGLSASKHVVALLAGRIWARPRLGGGSEFGFAVPLSEDRLD